MVNVIDAVNRCKNEVIGDDPDGEIILDQLLCVGAEFDDADTSNYKSFQMLMRYLEIYFFYFWIDMTQRAINIYPEVNFRYTIMPIEEIQEATLPMDFDPADIEKMLEYGERDAIEMVKLGEQTSTKWIIEYEADHHKNFKNFKEFLESKKKEAGIN